MTVEERWSPQPARPAPFWERPFRLTEVARWLPGYLWPWNAFHLATALVWVHLLLPDWASLRSLSVGNFAYLYLLNAVAVGLFFGAFEYFFYRRRRQATRYKYNPAFPGDKTSNRFWFRSQPRDNAVRTLAITVPLWTAVELLLLWVYANSWATWLPWSTHWLWLSVLVVVAPAVHEVYFFALHRLLHTEALYRRVHSVHHKSVNPSPWSSLSMHPAEGLPYMAEALLHLLVPSNPVCAYFTLHSVGFGAINGHLGFDEFELIGSRTVKSHAYLHYLHHKYFEVNYGGDGVVPLDKLFGTWHDGSPAAHAEMRARLRARPRR